MNKFKIIFVLTLLVSVFSCEDDDATNVSNRESGWVQFLNTSPDVEGYVLGIDAEAKIPVNIQVPSTSSDLVVNYELVSVSGDNPNNFFSATSLTVPAGVTSISGPDNNTGIEYGNLPKIELDLTNVTLTSNMIFDIVLTSTNTNSIKVGLNNEKKTVQRVSISPVILPSVTLGSTATGDSYSNDLGAGPGAVVPPYTVNFTPVSGEENTWDLDTSWGPDFVSNLCGGCVPPGFGPNPVRIVLNPDDLSVSVLAAQYSDPGTGTFDPCSETFSLNIPQTLFTGTFTVDVDLTMD
jgi:hypothetical protein